MISSINLENLEILELMSSSFYMVEKVIGIRKMVNTKLNRNISALFDH